MKIFICLLFFGLLGCSFSNPTTFVPQPIPQKEIVIKQPVVKEEFIPSKKLTRRDRKLLDETKHSLDKIQQQLYEMQNRYPDPARRDPGT